jgi:phytoene dehydrogenase-like protein
VISKVFLSNLRRSSIVEKFAGLDTAFDRLRSHSSALYQHRRLEKQLAAPFVLLGQPSLFDSSRAPSGRHTAWAYCHVPNGSSEVYTESIERQIVRFAPEFRDCILSRSVSTPKDLESWNSNLVGGDILGGAMNVRQLLFRPARSLYRTSRSGLYLCGASTPPGGGVHGMCGLHAARMALTDLNI